MQRIEKNPTKGGKIVLIVDDEPIVRNHIAHGFMSNGCAICGQADSASEGIEVAKQIKPDLIVLDLSMPKVNGLQAAPELRKVAPTARIILFTIHANSFLSEQAAKCGVDLVLSKDVGLAALLSKAHGLID